MPVDTEIKHYKAGSGKDKIVLPNGAVITGQIVPASEAMDGIGYTSHFATCKKASSLRRK